TGMLSVTVKVLALEEPLWGSKTESLKCPSSARNEAGMTAFSWEVLTKVVASGRSPLISTVERFVKLLPVMVIVRSGLPSVTEYWLRLVMLGGTVRPDRAKLPLNVAPPMMSVPMRSQSGASPGSLRIQLCRSVAPAGKGVPGDTIGLAADSQRKSAPAGALAESPILGTKK